MEPRPLLPLLDLPSTLGGVAAAVSPWLTLSLLLAAHALLGIRCQVDYGLMEEAPAATPPSPESELGKGLPASGILRCRGLRPRSHGHSCDRFVILSVVLFGLVYNPHEACSLNLVDHGRGYLGILLSCMIAEMAIIWLSMRGGILYTEPRDSMQYVLYVRLGKGHPPWGAAPDNSHLSIHSASIYWALVSRALF